MLSPARQFTIFLENKPGRLSDVANALAKAHVNIVALDIPQSNENSLIRIVGDEPGKTRSLLKREGFAFAENEVLLLNLENEPGALAAVTAKLGKAGINIEYAYGSTGDRSDHTRIVIQVSDVLKATRILGLADHPVAAHPVHEKPRYVNREGRPTRF
jgi:hypothetical protein